MLHLRETLTMPSSYYQDITEKVPEEKKAAMKESIDAEELKLNTFKGMSKIVESVNSKKLLEVLKEAKYTDSVVERVVAKLREGGVDVGKNRIYRVPVARINPPGTVNGNGRRYTKQLWENVMNNQESAWKGLCGLADHPTDDNDPGSFKNSSIVWLGMELDVPNNLVYGIGSFVGPYGHLAQEIIDAGGRVGFSSSGFGELMPDGETVNPETYQIERLADVVLNPSQSVYGVINDETSLGNIEYSRQKAVKESTAANNETRIQETINMDAKENGVKSALSKVEEKVLRRNISNFLKENVEIINPLKQLEDLREIQALIQEGQLTDLEADIETKLAEAQKRLEAIVENGLKLKETEVTIATDAPKDTSVEINADGVKVNVGEQTEPEAPVAPEAPVVVDAPVVDAPVEAPAETSLAGDKLSDTETPADTIIDAAAEEVGEKEEGEEEIFESKLSEREEKALREYVESFLNKDHSKESPLSVIAETNEILALVKEGKLSDMEESVVTRISDLQKQLNEDIEAAHVMKNELGVSSVNEVNESAKSIMQSGKLLAEQVTDYKELCEAITKRNQQIMGEYKALKAQLALAEAKADDKGLERNQTIVSLSEQVKELKDNYDKLDEAAGNKVEDLNKVIAELNESVKSYQEGNAKLEKANGLLKTQLKEAAAKLDAAEDKIVELNESVKAAKSEKQKLNENMTAGWANVAEYQEMKKENEALKAALATFKEKSNAESVLDITKLDEAASREIKILRREVSSLKNRLGEGVDNYVKSMENSVVSYYNDLEARYGESIKPYKNSFLNARSLREAQRMFMNVARQLEAEDKLDESETFVPAEGKVSDFYLGNGTGDADSLAASMGLM